MPVDKRSKKIEFPTVINVWIDINVRKELKRRAKEMGHSQASIIRILIDDWLKEQQKLESS